MVRSDSTRGDEELDAGPFSGWLGSVRVALRDGTGTDVPCGRCTACCSSSQFVHIAPDEADVLAAIPRRLLFPAPGAPKGHVLMGYDEQGRCPMLGDEGCTIYRHRPRTCRTYDCRVFPAAGVEPAPDEAKPLIAARARRWRFAHPTARDRAEHDAVRAAARFVAERAAELPEPARPRTTTQLAVLAVELHAPFLGAGPDGPDPADVRAALERPAGR